MTGGIRQVDDYQVRRYAEARILVADVSKSYSVPPMQMAKSTPQKSPTRTIVRDAYDQRIDIKAESQEF
jgi:hypothetical protein